MKILGISLYKGKYQDFLQTICSPQKPILVFTPNAEILTHSYHDADFSKLLKKADYNIPDGHGLYVAEEMQAGKNFFLAGFSCLFGKKKMKQKYGDIIKGSDITRDLFSIAEKERKSILIIDNYRITEPKNDFEINKKEIQKNFPNLLEKFYPKIQAFVEFDGEKSPQEMADFIQKNNIEYVFSCIGMKKQEERLYEIFEFLPQECGVVGIGVGASVDFLLGLQKRAPHFVQNIGLEWLYRLILEPKKRYRRIKKAFIEFPQIIKKEMKGLHKNNNSKS